MNASGATPVTNRLGIQAMIASQAFFSVSDVMVKLATASLPAGEIMALRGLFGTSIVIALFFFTGAHLQWRALAHPMVALRAIIEGVIAVMFVNAIGKMQMGNYTAILLASPLIITALAALLFKAKVGWRRWSAIAIGFGGVLCVAQPTATGIDTATWLAIGLAFLVAIRDLVTRGIPNHVPSMLVTLATSAVTTAIGIAMTVAGTRVATDGWTVLHLAVAAVAVSLANFLVIMATRKADVAVVAPFRFSVMPFALLSGFFVWGNVPDRLAILGIVLITGSGLYAIHRERMQTQRLAAG